MAVLVTKWFGTFLVEGGAVEREARFPLNARAVADRLLAIRRGEVLEEEAGLLSSTTEVLEPRLRAKGRLVDKTPFFDLEVAEPDRAVLHAASLLVAREDSRAAAGERDRFVAHAVRAMDEITKTTNTLTERAREWYALHFPEIAPFVPDAAAFARLLAEDPDRAIVASKLPKLQGVESIGVAFDEAELESIRGFAQSLQRLQEERKRMETLVAREARTVAPNLSHVVGDLIAARLISKAGSLEALAHLPASTLQTLGAEEALFQHLKEGKRPPKHGILFQHGLVNTAPWWQRGKISRILAGKAVLAARLDFFQTPARLRAEDLLRAVEAGVARVKKAYPRPRVGPRSRGRAPLATRVEGTR